MDVDQHILLRLMSASTFILPALPFLLLGLLLFLYALKRFWFNGLCPLRQRRILMGIPIFGTFIKLCETYFFASQFSGLLSRELSINDSIKLFSINQQQPFYQKLCNIIKDDLIEGRSLEMIFRELPYFDGNLPVVAANGQKYGRLDAELLHYSRFILEKIEERMNAILKNHSASNVFTDRSFDRVHLFGGFAADVLTARRFIGFHFCIPEVKMPEGHLVFRCF